MFNKHADTHAKDANGIWTRINPRKCPHFIFNPVHYREDGSCKCGDSKDPYMKGWGYRWSKKEKRWK